MLCGGFGFRWCAFRSEVALVLNVCLGVCLCSFELLGGFVLLLGSVNSVVYMAMHFSFVLWLVTFEFACLLML